MVSDFPASNPAELSLTRSASRDVSGNGTMAELIRAFPWDQTPLGPIAGWSDTLLATVNMVIAAPVPMQLLWEREMTVLYNDAFLVQIGAKHPDGLGRPAEQVWSEVWSLVAQQLDETLHKGVSLRFERVALHLAIAGEVEETFWNYTYSPIREPDGRIAGILNVSQSITETVRSEAALRSIQDARNQALQTLQQGEERLRLTLSAANGVGTWDWDVPSDLVYADRRFAEAYSVDATRAAAGCPIAGFMAGIHPDDRQRVGEEIHRALGSGGDYTSDYRLKKPTGETQWITAYGRCHLDEKGEPLRFPGLIVDITERKQTEETLRQSQSALLLSEDRLRRSQAAGRVASWEWDIEQDVLTWDGASLWVYGRLPSEMRSTAQIFPFLHPEDREGVRLALQPAIQGLRDYQAEFRVFWPDGSMHWISAFGTPVFSEGKVVRIAGMNMDITERKRADEALIQNEKVAAVGRLASSIAHEINNPLESVTNLLYLARHSTSLEEAQVYLESADTELRRASSITNQTLRFHKQATSPTAVTAEELLDGVLSVHRSRIVNAHVTVERRDRTQCPVLCFEGEIRQVLSNLVGNAVDAMQSGDGRLLLRSRVARDWVTDRRGLAITVADTGMGMSGATVAQVFQAFFTTKGIAGTGLGLWVSKEILDRHHGELRVRSSQRPRASGTVFVIFLPFEAVGRT